MALAQQPVLQVQDGAGNPVSQSGTVVTATIASGPAGATLSGATATTGVTGAATFSGLAISGIPLASISMPLWLALAIGALAAWALLALAIGLAAVPVVVFADQ